MNISLEITDWLAKGYFLSAWNQKPTQVRMEKRFDLCPFEDGCGQMARRTRRVRNPLELKIMRADQMAAAAAGAAVSHLYQMPRPFLTSIDFSSARCV